jgi:hypothetical protein
MKVPNTDSIDQLNTILDKWVPLLQNSKKVLIWDYFEKRQIIIVYRFVANKGEQSFTIYVGSGDNLSGDSSPTSLRYQYRNGNRTKTIRPKIEQEIEKLNVKGFNSWTEIIDLDNLKEQREIIENLAIFKYWLENIRNSKVPDNPKFLNDKIEKLEELGLIMNHARDSWACIHGLKSFMP